MAASQLMKNHVAGAPLPAQKQLRVLNATDGTPLIFTLNEHHQLLLTRQDASSVSGFRQHDVGAQLRGNNDLQGLRGPPVVQGFAVSQELSGEFWLSVAVGETAEGPSTLLVSPLLSADPVQGDLGLLGIRLRKRELPASAVIQALSLGPAGAAQAHPLVVAFATVGAEKAPRHYLINPDPADPSWSYTPLSLPLDVDECLALAVGRTRKDGMGVYTLCKVGSAYSLMFTGLPVLFEGQPVSSSTALQLPERFTPRTLAVLPGAGGLTELYLGGDGVYRYTAAAQARSNLAPEKVVDNVLFSGMRELVVRHDAANAAIQLWGRNARDQVTSLTGRHGDGSAIDWEVPVYVAHDVSAFDAVRAAENTTLLLGGTDGSLEMLVQAPQTSLWSRQQLEVPKPGAVTEVTSYTTRIEVRDEDGVPLSGQFVGLRASFNAAVRVNGLYMVLRADATRMVRTDASGLVTIIRETDDLSVPHYTVWTEDSTVLISPFDVVRRKLEAVQKADDVLNARMESGVPLLPRGASREACEAAARSIHGLLQVLRSLPQDGGSAPVPLAGAGLGPPEPRQAWGVQFTKGGPFFLEQEMAFAPGRMLPGGWLDPVRVAAGSLFQTVASGLEKVQLFLVESLPGGRYRFIVDLGQRALDFVFESAPQVMRTVAWVCKATLSLEYDRLCDWLGFVFDWSSVLRTQKVLRNLLKTGLKDTVKNMARRREEADKLFEALRPPPAFDRSAPEYQGRARKAPATDGVEGQSPASDWARYHLFAGMDSVLLTKAAPPDALEHVFDGLRPDDAVVDSVLSQVKDRVFDGFSQMTWAELLAQVTGLLTQALLEAVKATSLNLLQTAEVLLEALERMISMRWDIPVLTHVFEQVICKGDGTQLTLMDLAALLVAVPTTIVYKAVSGCEPFAPELAVAAAEAPDYQALLHVLSGPPRASAAMGRTERTALSRTINVLNYATAFSRSSATLCYALRETAKVAGRDETASLANLMKVVADWHSYVFGGMNIELGLKRAPDTSLRRDTENSLALFQTVFRIRDTLLGYYWSTRGKEYNKTVRTWLNLGESLVGMGMVAAYGYAFFLELQEPLPEAAQRSDVAEREWRAMMGLKFSTNMCTSLYRVLSVGTALPQPQLKEGVVVARGVLLGLRSVGSLGYAVSETLYNQNADLEGLPLRAAAGM